MELKFRVGDRVRRKDGTHGIYTIVSIVPDYFTGQYSHLARPDEWELAPSEPPTEPRFRVGDRVVIRGHVGSLVRLVKGLGYVCTDGTVWEESSLELAPPEPPKLPWIVAPAANGGWDVKNEGGATISDEDLARCIARMLNGEQAQ